MHRFILAYSTQLIQTYCIPGSTCLRCDAKHHNQAGLRRSAARMERRSPGRNSLLRRVVRSSLVVLPWQEHLLPKPSVQKSQVHDI